MLHIFSFVLAVASIPLGYAQSISSATPSSTSSAAPTHTVSVGAEGLVFTPNQLTADVGDVVEFIFYPQNHSIARSGWKSPCIPYEDTGANRDGFWSGFQPIAVVLNDPPKFRVTVNDTDPIFFYCSAPGACLDNHMIGVINANATETFETQLAFTKNATLMFSPGEYFPSEIAPTTSSSSSSSTSPTPTSTATVSPSATATQSVSSGHSLSPGAIAGIAIGGAAVVILGAALIYLCGRQRTMGELIHHSQQHSAPPSYAPNHHVSTASSASGYPLKGPQFEFTALPQRRYSAQGAYRDRSATDTESNGSGSPTSEEMRERDMMVPPIHVARSLGNLNTEHVQSPPISRPAPMSPISPMGDTMYLKLNMEPPPPHPLENLRIDRYDSSRGPHELAVESEPVYRPSDPKSKFGP